MSVVAEFSVPADAFCLAKTLEAVPSATVELDRLAAHSPDYVMPFLWVLDTNADAFATAIETDATVEAAEVTDSFGETSLYQMTWADVVSDRLKVILDHDGVLLEGRASGDKWRFGVRFGSRDHFADFREHFIEFGEVQVHQLSGPKVPLDVSYGVTSKQREALLTAHDAGYYETPGAVSGEEVAQMLGITQQAVSKRLQRGISTLIDNTLGRHRDE